MTMEAATCSGFGEGSALSASAGCYATADLSRKRPKATQLDLEKMFQDSMALDQMHRQLQQQNEQLRSQLSKVDALRSERQNLISSVQSVISEKSKELRPQAKCSSWLVFKLKKHLHTLKRQIQNREKQIGDFQKHPQHQILVEKEVLFQVRQNELSCLNKLISEMNIPNEQSASNARKRQLYEMQMVARLQQDKLQSLQVQQLQLQNQFQLEQRTVQKVAKRIQQEQEQARKILEQQEELRLLEEMALQRRHMEKKALSAVNEVTHSSADRKSSGEMLAELEAIKSTKSMRIRELEATIDKIREREAQQKVRLEAELRLLTNEVAERTAKTSPTRPKDESAKPTTNGSIVLEKEPLPILMARVKPGQVAHLGRYLRFNLTTKKYTHDRWKRQLFSEQDTTVSIRTMIERLQKHPFEIGEFEEAKLLARYLIEDDTQKIYYCEKASQSVPIVKAILEKAIGPIRIYTPAEEEQVSMESSTILIRYRALVIPALQAKADKRATLTQKELLEVIEGCMLDLTAEHLEYLVVFLFSFSKSLKQLRIADVEKLGMVPLNYQTDFL